MSKPVPLGFHLILFENKWLALAAGSELRVFSLYPTQHFQTEDLETKGHKEIIRSACFCSGSNLFVSGGDDKALIFWDTLSWTCLANRKSKKKITCVVSSSRHVIYADKTGLVFILPIDNLEAPPQLILGHFSTVTRLLLTPDRKFLLSADRDEKIRVSAFPNAFDIQSFCLGHTAFVNVIRFVLSSQGGNHRWLLLSGGGDGTIRLWDHLNGTLIDTLSVGSKLGFDSSTSIVVSSMDFSEKHRFAVATIERSTVIVILEVIERDDRTFIETKQIFSVSTELISSACFDGEGNIWIVGSHLYPFIGFYFDRTKACFEPIKDSPLLSCISSAMVYVNEPQKQKIVDNLDLELLRKVKLSKRAKKRLKETQQGEMEK